MFSRQLIFTYLLLGAYSILLVHALVPHQHDESHSDQSIHEHHHQHDHHHAHEEAGILQWLFDLMNTHEETSDDSHHELVYTNPNTVQMIDIMPDADLLPQVSSIDLSPAISYASPVIFRQRHRCNSDPPDSTTRSHRGPPALG